MSQEASIPCKDLSTLCKLLAGLLPAKSVAILARRSSGVQVECLERGSHITSVRGRAYPCGRECCGTGGELCTACCH